MTALGLAMRQLREAGGLTQQETADAYRCSVSHISRVEHGSTVSRSLVRFYDERFEGDGMLLSLFETAVSAAEQARRRSGGRRGERPRAAEGDATAFVDQGLPHGQLMQPGERFVQIWRIRNVGKVPWSGRRLERQGPLAGPGLITSERYVTIPDTEPGAIAEIKAELRAPTYDCSSIAYFKMVDESGALCFPDVHQLGLDVLVRVERNRAGFQDPPELEGQVDESR